jgi:alginate O-acetyltransferase complex protein AlgJ
MSVKKSITGESKLNVLNGEWASSFETRFDEGLIHHSLSLSFWNGLNAVLFKEGKDGVLIGDDGWLFSTEEFERPKGYEQNIYNNLKYIANVKEALDQINIDLIVVPVPAKARVLESKLGRYEFPEYRQSVYSQFLTFLLSNEIQSFDLFSEIKNTEDFFLKTDTHWSLNGSELTAKNVQALLDTKLLRPYKQNYDITREGGQSLKGDLTRYTVKSSEDMNAVALTGGTHDDLFGDTYIPVTLVGTSYSADKRWGFEKFLKYHLQTDVLNMADEGLGPFEVMRNYLKSNELKNTKPKLIIWEIPERYLPIKFEGREE